ncbi:MAG: hypothetical protein P4L55_11185 [Syntrophobacteraceae bacterium]|nr:hypothetical protein [Syntrophobacteraceae bacterium]
MSYGLRRYETLHRLWWLVFFLLCLFWASLLPGLTSAPQRAASLSDLGKIGFWTGLKGIEITSAGSGLVRKTQIGTDDQALSADDSSAPNVLNEDISAVGGWLLFLIRVAVIFLILRLIWLIVQYAGRYLLQLFMSEIRGLEPSERGGTATGADAILPVQALDARIRRSVLSFVLHPFIRLRLTLSGFRGPICPENVIERERRAVEADWRILYGSWGPYRWLLWILPILGLVQTVLLLVAQFNGLGLMSQKEALSSVKPLLDSNIQKQIMDTVKPTLSLLLPFIQAAGVAVFLQLAATLLRFFEELYLSSLDAFIFDRLLSRLPVGGNDTAVILEMLQRQIKEFGAALGRLEKRLLAPTGGDRLR